MSGPGSRPALSGRTDLAAALALAAGVVVFWLIDTVLLRGAGPVKSFDLVNYYVPLYEVTFAKLASGSLPLWNPYHLAGLPWLATLQAGVFYPPRWLYALLPSNVALASSHALHLALIAVSMAALARKAGLSWPAAALAAIPFTLRGTTQWWLQFPSVLEAGAWLPLGAVAVLGIARAEGTRPIALLALATGMSLLAGYTQATVFCITAWGTMLLALLVGERAAPGRWLSVGAVFAAGLGVGALVGAIQVLPTFELTLEGTRTTESLTRVQAQTVGAKASFLLGQALIGGHVSLGATLLALAPGALFLKRRRALAVWALLVALATYALAVGTSTSLVEVYRALPVIGWFRNPRRLLFLTNFALAILAAISCDGILRRGEGSRVASGVAVGVALALSVHALRLGESAMAGLALALGLAVAVSAIPSLRLPSGVLAGVLIALALGDAALERSTRGRLPYDDASTAAYRQNAAFFRRLAAQLRGDRATWVGVRRDRELKLAAQVRLRWLDDYEPLTLRRQSEYFTFLQHGTQRLWNARGSFAGHVLPRSLKPQTVPQWVQIAQRRRLLDLASTRYFVMARQFVNREAARAFISTAGLQPERAAARGWAVFTNPNALPRSYVTYRTEPAPPTGDLLRLLADPAFDPLASSFVEGDLDLAASGGAHRGHPAKIVRDEETLVEVEADLVAPGLLVLGDSYMRGWRATVDGERAPIFPTNHLFRGVPVPAGRHAVRFEYRPQSVRAGGVLALAGVAIWTVLVTRSRRS